MFLNVVASTAGFFVLLAKQVAAEGETEAILAFSFWAQAGQSTMKSSVKHLEDYDQNVTRATCFWRAEPLQTFMWMQSASAKTFSSIEKREEEENKQPQGHSRQVELIQCLTVQPISRNWAADIVVRQAATERSHSSYAQCTLYGNLTGTLRTELV